jgi:hypothetical protein
MLETIFINMKDMGWNLDNVAFDKVELVRFHLEELETMFYELEKQNKENDSLGFITDLIRALLKEEK